MKNTFFIVGAILLLSSCVISEDGNFNYIRARNRQKVEQNSEQGKDTLPENGSEQQNENQGI